MGSAELSIFSTVTVDWLQLTMENPEPRHRPGWGLPISPKGRTDLDLPEQLPNPSHSEGLALSFLGIFSCSPRSESSSRARLYPNRASVQTTASGSAVLVIERIARTEKSRPSSFGLGRS